MKQYLKYSSEIDWDYKVKNRSFNSKPAETKTPEKKFINKRPNQKYNINIDYSGFLREKKRILNKKSTVRKKRKNKFSLDMISKRSFLGIYYGALFLFIVGFLFFLSISIGFASSFRGRVYGEDNLYSEDRSVESLRQYLIYDNENIGSNERTQKFLTKKIEYSKYRVMKNDSYEKVSNKFGLSIDTILLVNDVKKDTILKVGSILLVPNQNGRSISVKKNDSIYKIADRHGVKWEKIVDANDLVSSIIVPGMKLFIPNSKMTNYEREQFYDTVFSWPVKGRLTSYFGSRIDPFTGTYGFHSGIDIKSKSGRKIKAANNGKIIFVGWQKTYGNFIMIKHNDNVITTYAHLSKVDVKKNQKVEKGEYIGKIGTTGRSTGPHLHFEVRKNGKLINPFNILK